MDRSEPVGQGRGARFALTIFSNLSSSGTLVFHRTGNRSRMRVPIPIRRNTLRSGSAIARAGNGAAFPIPATHIRLDGLPTVAPSRLWAIIDSASLRSPRLPLRRL